MLTTPTGFSYMRGIAYGSEYGWNYTTTDEKNFPLGRGLGGGSAVNGMFWTRPDARDFDAWAALNGGDSWNWEDLNSYIKKAENIVPPKAENQEQFHIVNDDGAHGHDGPLKVGWSDYIYKVTENWIPTFEALGIKAIDLAGGDNHGAAIIPSTLDPEAGTRSCPRNKYIAEQPQNLVILTGQHVTQITFDEASKDSLFATGVEFAPAMNEAPAHVKAKKEVIVTAGAIGSPKVLQLSGIGPKSVLEPLGITTKLDLPVGYNFQDHVMVLVEYNAVEGTETWNPLCMNKEAQETELAAWRESKSGVLTYVNEATSYVKLSDTGKTVEVNIDDVINAHGDLPENVKAGYKAQYEIMQGWLQDKTQIETIMNIWGSQVSSIKFESAVQHPWSRGSVFVKSANPWDMPAINPNYLGVEADVQLLQAGVEFVRKMAGTAPFGDVLTDELSPGPDNTDLVAWMKTNCGSEYHPIGTCPMLPQDKGGVVDTNLLVYGTKNVRVVDSSVVPIQVSAHTMGPTYGVAEKGADVIKAAYAGNDPALKDSTKPSASGVQSTAGSKATGTSSTADKADKEDKDADSKTASGADADKAESAASPLAVSWVAVALVVLPFLA